MPQQRWPILVSLIWLAVGLGLALAMPWLWMLPPPVLSALGVGAVAATWAMIAWCLVTAIRMTLTTGRTLRALPLTLVQYALFTLLFFQIAAHFGAENYRFADGQPPTALGWLGFTFAHTIRAGDLFDTFHVYTWNPQWIHHVGLLTSLSVLAFHVVIDLFLLSLLADAFDAVFGRFRKRFRWVLVAAWCVAFAAVVILTMLVWWDRGLFRFAVWLGDNAIRVFDFPDLMEVFHWNLWLSQGSWKELRHVTMLTRIILALGFAGLLSRLRAEAQFRWFGGVGLGRDELERYLKSSDATLRQRAKDRLAAWDEADRIHAREGRRPIPWLGWLAATGWVSVLVLAWWLLDRPGAAAEAQVQAATQPDSPAFANAMAGLRRLGPAAGTQTVQQLADARPRLPRPRQLELIDGLGYLGRDAVAPLEALAGNDDEELSLRAVQALFEGPMTRDHAEALERLLVSPRLATRTAVLDGMRHRLSELLHYDDFAVYSWASTIQDVGELTEVMDRMEPGQTGYGEYLGTTIMSKGSLAWSAVPALKKALAKGDESFRAAAAEWLGRVGPLAADAVPDLIRAVGDSSLPVRRKAAEALGGIGPQAVEGVPVLVAALAEGDKELRLAAVKGLAGIGRPAVAALPALLGMADDKDYEVRASVATALGAVGPGPEPAAAVAALTKKLGDPENRVREQAALGLGRFGPAAATAAPALIIAARGDASQVRLAAVRTLAAIAPPTPELIAALTASLADKDEYVVAAAADGLGKLGPRAGSSIPALISVVEIGGYSARRSAIKALGEMGPVAAAALPAIAKAAGSSDSELRKAAETAMRRIDLASRGPR